MFRKIDFIFYHPTSDFNNCHVCIEFNNYLADVTYSMTGLVLSEEKEEKKIRLSPEDSRRVREMIEDAWIETWNETYRPEGGIFILDGYSWELTYENDNAKPVYKHGSNAYPWCFYKFIRAIIMAAPELESILERFAVEKESVY